MTEFETAYDLALRAARPVLALAGHAPGKAAAALEGRLGAGRTLLEWAATQRRPGVPLFWLHGASAGEIAGAALLVPAARAAFESGLHVVVTCASPSGLAAARAAGADAAGFIPFDARTECGRVLEALRPDALVFAKGDVWPGLSRAASERGIPLGMVNATVGRRSSRLAWPARRLLRDAHARLDAVGAASEEDRRRLVRLGVPPGRIAVTGDAAFPAAVRRVDAARDSPASRLPLRPPDVLRLVAGSIWPPDERMLLAAAARFGPGLQLVLVPHEPTPARIRRLRAGCRRGLGRDPLLWSEIAAGAGRRPGPGRRPVPGPGPGPGRQADGESAATGSPILVDAVGFLAELYLEADLAFVGGASGGGGLHSVIEPAAAGVPVLFGPRHDRREASALLERGAARVVPPDDAADVLRELAVDPHLRARMGAAARAFATSEDAAVEAGARLVAGLLERGVRRRSAAGA